MAQKTKRTKGAEKTALQNPLASGRKRTLEEGIGRNRVAEFKKLIKGGWRKIPRMLKGSSEDIAIVAELLSDGNENTRASAARALWGAADARADITAAIPALVKALGNRRARVRMNAAGALASAAGKGADIAIAIPALAKLLGDENGELRRLASLGLGNAAEREADMSAAIPALGKALGDGYADVRKYAAWALGSAAWKGADISAAISALVKTLGDENESIRANAARALMQATNPNHKDQKARTRALDGIIGFMRSDWFQREMERNSVTYETLARSLAELFGKIKETEAVWA